MNAHTGEIRVLLVAPHYAQRISRVAQTTIGPPLGLAYLAAGLERCGIAVTILDANAERLSDEQTVARIVHAAPQVVGLTAVTPTVDQAGALCESVRRQLPETLTMMGGIHPTILPAPTLEKFPALDLIVRGEADQRLAELLKGWAEGRAWRDFPGVSFRDENGRPASTPDAALVEDLDALPLPARHLLPMHRYRSPDGDRFTTMVGTRGCPQNCIYCSVGLAFGRRLRLRDPRSIVAEMDECRARYGTRVFGFIDDTFTSEREWVVRLCEALLAAPTRTRWFCLTRVDKVDPELLRLMRRAGCFKVEYGLESGDPDVLAFLQKGIEPRQVLDAFRWTREAKLDSMAFVMLFSPAETERSLQRTRELIWQADPDYLQVSFCTPYPGTRLARLYAERGVELPDDWRRYVFLVDPPPAHPLFSRERMLWWQRNLLRAFFLRPRTIGRIVGAAVRNGGWRGFFRTARLSLRSLLRG
ncbi:MAG TPA: radical SAM protein [bacterium]|nr:radical SAM protein [bacterium]